MVKLYAVRKGKNTGIYNTWAEAEQEVKGFNGAEFKSFKNMEDALDYMGDEEAKQARVAKRLEELNNQIDELTRERDELLKD